MLVFVGHDPGAKNHLAPLYTHAVRQGYPSHFVDLSGSQVRDETKEIASLLSPKQVSLLVCGCSENQAEWRWVRKARRAGVLSAMLVDVGAGIGLTGIQAADFPDRFLVTSERCADELRQRGCPSQRIHVIGSPHLESLSVLPELKERSGEVKSRYDMDVEGCIVSFFLPSCDVEPGLIPRFHSLLTASCLHDWMLIVRPHPRNSRTQVQASQNDCQVLANVLLDRKGGVDTATLLASSVMLFALGSTVSAESLVLGIPAAFFQIGWNYSSLDQLYQSLEFVPRIRTAAQFQRFVSKVVNGQFNDWPKSADRLSGATARGWEALRELAQL